MNIRDPVESGKMSRMARTTSDRSPMEIARRLIATRCALGIKQSELCRRAGIAPNRYNQWEAGQRPSLDGAIALCEAFGLTLDWIYFGDASRLPHDLAKKIESGNGRPPPSKPMRPGKGSRPQA